MKTSKNDSGARQLTVRIPRHLFEQSRKLAGRRRVSVNRLVRSLLEELVLAERVRALENAYQQLGEDAAEEDVRPFEKAQAEVIRRG